MFGTAIWAASTSVGGDSHGALWFAASLLSVLPIVAAAALAALAAVWRKAPRIVTAILATLAAMLSAPLAFGATAMVACYMAGACL